MALRKYGLSHETFRAWILTLEGVVLLAKNLIAKHGFHYVLLGKMQSDPLEGRFGMYRQLNGASFFVSVREVMLAEKKIRVLNLMQLKTIEAAANNLNNSTSSFLPGDSDISLEEDITWLAKKLEVPIFAPYI